MSSTLTARDKEQQSSWFQGDHILGETTNEST